MDADSSEALKSAARDAYTVRVSEVIAARALTLIADCCGY
jgi:hypothetical protein